MSGKQSLRLWMRLLSCATVLEKRVRAKLVEEFGTTLPRFDVLAALDRNPDGLRMSALSEWLLVSRGNVTAVVDRLAEDGWVERTPDAKDRRVLHVRLTRLGKSEFARMAAAHQRWIEHGLRDLADRDVVALMAGLQRLQRSIDANTF